MAEDVQLANPSKKRKIDAVYDNTGSSNPATMEDTTYSALQLSDTDMDSHRNAGEGGQTDDDLLETSKSSVENDCDSDSSSGYSNLSGEEAWRPISGPMSWVYRHIEKGSDPRQILQQIVPDDELPKSLPPNIPDYMLWKLVISIVSEPPMRKKLSHVNTLSDVVWLMKSCSKIVVLTGAGVSVSCGIPDFRSRNGIYARLAVDFPDLPDPQAMFDINYFRNDQRPFFKFAKEIYPGQFEPSRCHKFIRLIEEHGKLLRNYTQNIDTLEQVAGISNVIQCHGSFATATCMLCRHKCTAEDIKGPIMQQIIPRCPKCPDDWPNAVMKPDIVFFGESLPEEFHSQMAADKDECDLLIVIGSSLKVRPVALIPNSLPAEIPQILINKEPLRGQQFDVELLGDCDMIVGELCRQLGDTWDAQSGGGTALTEVSFDMLLTPPATPEYGDSDGDTLVGNTVDHGQSLDVVEGNSAGDREIDKTSVGNSETCSSIDHGQLVSSVEGNRGNDCHDSPIGNSRICSSSVDHGKVLGAVEGNSAGDRDIDTVDTDDRQGAYNTCDHGQKSQSDEMQIGKGENGSDIPCLPASSDLVGIQCGNQDGVKRVEPLSQKHICLPDTGPNDDNIADSDNVNSGQDAGSCGNTETTEQTLDSHVAGESCRLTAECVSSGTVTNASVDINADTSNTDSTADNALVLNDSCEDNVSDVNTTAEAASEGDSQSSGSQTEHTLAAARANRVESTDSGIAYGDRDICGTSSNVEELQKLWKPAMMKISVSKRLGANQYCFMPPSRYVFTDAEVYTELETDSDGEMDENNSAADPDDHSEYNSDADMDDNREISATSEMDSGSTDADTSLNSTKNSIALVDTEGSMLTDIDDCEASMSCVDNSESLVAEDTSELGE